MMLLCLLSALFLPDLWVLADRPDFILDVLLTCVLCLFLVELMLQSIGLAQSYWRSFFFWMDLLGAASLLLDLSYLGLLDIISGSNNSVASNVVVMRAARIAKLGARASRFTKLVKLLRFLPGMDKGQATAKVISARLLTALSTRVSCLIILMVVLMPVFSLYSFPDHDWSMVSWMEILDGLADTPRFQQQLNACEKFYAGMQYYPYRMESPAATWHSRSEPKRRSNIVILKTQHLTGFFNFTMSNQIDAALNIALVLLIMFLMLGFSLVLSTSVSSIVLHPLEKLLQQVKDAAATIFKSVNDMTEGADDVSQEGEVEVEAHAFQNETQILARIIEKLSVLGEVVTSQADVEAQLKELNEKDRAILSAYHEGYTAPSGRSESKATVSQDMLEQQHELQQAMLSDAGLSLELLDSWHLNPLEFDRTRCNATCIYLLGRHNHGLAFDAVLLSNFVASVEQGYGKTAYHNWFHALDVTHGVYRLLRLGSAELYLNSIERGALLVSACSHDLGHPGLNNPFLVETSHDLALRYNDKSPLENMHCAKLFQLLSNPLSNLFSSLSRKDFQDARKICIEVILHTDMAQHFQMIKEVQLLHEMNSELLPPRRSFPSPELTNCFEAAESRQLLRKLLLHVADVSNPLKPFRVCRVWARKVLEEMFAQGDQEKALGIPLQPLNDRTKVNVPHSQVGFIEFLVAPLAYAVTRVLPPLEPCAAHMLENVKAWRAVWLSETQPAPSEDEVAAMEHRIRNLEGKFPEL